MSPQKIAAALKDIRRERDPNIKSQKLASLVSALFRARGIELVVVGGSAIEFYTDGAYQSGDVDLCQIKPYTPIPLRLRQEIMGQLGAKGGPRSWEVAGMFVDLLGMVETESKDRFPQAERPLRRCRARQSRGIAGGTRPDFRLSTAQPRGPRLRPHPGERRPEGTSDAGLGRSETPCQEPAIPHLFGVQRTRWRSGA